MAQKGNRLTLEKSPYLLEHAMNPVDWYPWGREAAAKAKNDGKPVFLSIGYSTCHWCHVMRRESFEDEKVAAFINRHFIPVKVDREERPEVDAYYMKAVQAITGSGGWPLSVFLTADLKPFYGGTYYPPEPRYGMPSFMQVLEFVMKLWKERRGEVSADADRILAAVMGPQQKPSGFDAAVLEDGYAALLSSFDPDHGGFGGAPKFPLPASLSFLMLHWYRTGKSLALSGVVKTLDEMAAGGIRDHVGGGFHRYSTDRVWVVPHFEKMLYDNALLAKTYVDGYLITGKPEYAQVARETLGWMLEEMRDPEGGFYSAQDADTEEGEGVYYTWTPEEVTGVLGGTQGEEFCRVYGVTKTGNFEGRTILHTDPSAPQGEDIRQKVGGWKRRLYESRIKRPRPVTDTKVLTSWNGLAVSAFAYAGGALGDESYLEAAERAADFVLKTNSKEGKLLRRYAGGEAGLEGTLEDYAYFIDGLLDLYEASPKPRWLREAVRLAEVMLGEYEDEGEGGFYFTLSPEPARLKETYDGPTPSGNAAAASCLMRLSELTGDPKFRLKAERGLRSFGEELRRNPTAHMRALSAVDLAVNGGKEVVIAAKSLEDARGLVREVRSRYLPELSLIVATSESFDELARVTPLLEGRGPGERPLAYVCQGFVCDLPTDSADRLAEQLAPRYGFNAPRRVGAR